MEKHFFIKIKFCKSEILAIIIALEKLYCHIPSSELIDLKNKVISVYKDFKILEKNKYGKN